MQVKADALESTLRKSLHPIYIISGDDPLLMQESSDAIRSACKAAGYSERVVFDVDANFDWSQILAECNAISLFADRKIIEIRIPSAKVGKDGGAAVRDICSTLNDDNVILICTGKLERGSDKSAWYKAIDAAGVCVVLWPPRRHELPHWVRGRLQTAGFRASDDAVRLLCERVEGNLLAASQEIEKLRLLLEPGHIDAEAMTSVISDSARFSPYDVADRALEGNPSAAIRTLNGLRAEGVDAYPILWFVSEELRKLLKLAAHRAAGMPMDQAIRTERMFSKPHLESAIQRLGTRGLHQLLKRCSIIDRCIKGLEQGDPWVELQSLVLKTAQAGTRPR